VELYEVKSYATNQSGADKMITNNTGKRSLIMEIFKTIDWLYIDTIFLFRSLTILEGIFVKG
jgi:hypothetical protein